jgi:ankyrin repeat protein
VDQEFEAAVTAGDVRVVRRRLDEGADPDARDRHGQTGLMIAAHHGHGEVVDVLVTAGADLDVTAKYTLTALMLAIVARHEEVARRLLAAGASTTVRGSGAPGFHGKTAADLAREQGLRDLARLLG